ncbi:helix-turn-helix domain-containing protein, partial [Paraprevotella clara]
TCLSLYYSLISVKIGDKNKLGYRESMLCLLKSFMCELYGVIGRYISVGAVNYSQGHNLFKGFLDLLTSVYPKPRSVSFYAETLNVTSKYLSSVCKATCGETASMLIHKAVTKDIADLLSYSNKSIKEIMVELDFPSLSFFGKYVKKHFGVGPKEYRSKRLS